MPITDYAEFTFQSDGINHRVFHRGAGPCVIVLHEIYGLAPACVALGDRLAADFSVYMP